MKKTEYADIQYFESSDPRVDLDLEKKDETALPNFVKEVPTSSKRSESNGSVKLDHAWKNSNSDRIRTQEIAFNIDEQLSDVYMVNARDGSDTISLMHSNCVYILRKTTKEVAKAIYSMSSKIQDGVESVVGWLKTVLGNYYLISKIDHFAWSFDSRLAKHANLLHVDCDKLDDSQRKKLCDLVVTNLATLHSRKFVLGRFTLNSIILTNDGAKFTDLRNLRSARRLSSCVEEFNSLMQYLFAIGLMKEEDRYLAIATYNAMNEDACSEWYKEKAGKKAAEPIAITDLIEDEIFG